MIDEWIDGILKNVKGEIKLRPGTYIITGSFAVPCVAAYMTEEEIREFVGHGDWNGRGWVITSLIGKERPPFLLVPTRTSSRSS